MKKVSDEVTRKVLEITAKVFKEWQDRVIIHLPKYRDNESGMSLRDMVEVAIKHEGNTPEDIERYNNYIKTGILDETEEVVDQVSADLYIKDLDSRLLDAMDKGILPKDSLPLLKKKTRKYVRKVKSSCTFYNYSTTTSTTRP